MDLIVDTHSLAWVGTGDTRLSKRAFDAIVDPGNPLFVSAITAFEYTDLRLRNRLPGTADLFVLGERLGFQIIHLPAETWYVASLLPDIHRDPIDRLLLAHALQGGFTVVTGDGKMRSYPVPTLW